MYIYRKGGTFGTDFSNIEGSNYPNSPWVYAGGTLEPRTTYTDRAVVYDRSGNKTTSNELTFTSDYIDGPSMTVANSTTYTKEKEVTIEMTGYTTRWTNDGSDPTSSSSIYSSTSKPKLTSNSMVIKAAWFNGTTRVSKVTSATTDKIDTTPPSTTKWQVTETGTTTIKVTIAGTDALSEVKTYRFLISSTSSSSGFSQDGSLVDIKAGGGLPVEQSHTYSGLTMGKTYYLKAEVADVAGNVYTTNVLTVTTKAVTPTITVSDLNTWTKTKTVTVTHPQHLGADNSDMRVWIPVDGYDKYDYNSPYRRRKNYSVWFGGDTWYCGSWLPTEDGGSHMTPCIPQNYKEITNGIQFTIDINCTVYAGLYTPDDVALSDRASVTISRIDNAVPTVTVSGNINDGKVVRGSATISDTGGSGVKTTEWAVVQNGASLSRYSYNGTQTSYTANRTSFTLNHDSFQVTVTVTDNAGNSTTVSTNTFYRSRTDKFGL